MQDWAYWPIYNHNTRSIVISCHKAKKCHPKRLLNTKIHTFFEAANEIRLSQEQGKKKEPGYYEGLYVSILIIYRPFSACLLTYKFFSRLFSSQLFLRTCELCKCSGAPSTTRLVSRARGPSYKPPF